MMIIGHWSYFLENIYFKYRTKKLSDEDSFLYFPILKTPHDPVQRTPLVSTYWPYSRFPEVSNQKLFQAAAYRTDTVDTPNAAFLSES